MKAADVAAQLRLVVPSLTSLFSTNLTVTSLTYDAGIVTAVTSTAHGLSTQNNGVLISGALVPNPIISLTSDGLVASATTENNHDLTANQHDIANGYEPLVSVEGADFTEYN